jgi:hypothetical protein
LKIEKQKNGLEYLVRLLVVDVYSMPLCVGHQWSELWLNGKLRKRDKNRKIEKIENFLNIC